MFSLTSITDALAAAHGHLGGREECILQTGNIPVDHAKPIVKRYKCFISKFKIGSHLVYGSIQKGQS